MIKKGNTKTDTGYYLVKIDMLINNFNDLQIPEYVIGAGPAGTTLVDQLSQANKTVLLLKVAGKK